MYEVSEGYVSGKNLDGRVVEEGNLSDKSGVGGRPSFGQLGMC